jgi:hypothetical protein
MLLQSTIVCPQCAVAKAEIMPTDACQFFYECTGCGTKLKPKSGDCCVFCSYGSVPCPPIQEQRAGGLGASSCCGDGEGFCNFLLDRDHDGVRDGLQLILPHFRWKLFGGRGHRGLTHADQRQR